MLARLSEFVIEFSCAITDDGTTARGETFAWTAAASAPPARGPAAKAGAATKTESQAPIAPASTLLPTMFSSLSREATPEVPSPLSWERDRLISGWSSASQLFRSSDLTQRSQQLCKEVVQPFPTTIR